MKLTIRLMIPGLLAILALVWSVPASAGEKDNSALADLLSGIADSLVAEQQDEDIASAFRDELGREPTDREYQRYRTMMDEHHWSVEDVRDDLRGRSDYRRHGSGSSKDVEQVIRRAYDDILHREPDRDGMRTFRSHMIDDGWTEQDVREALRKSQEFDRRSSESADKIVRRAYQDLLHREPDHNGLVTFRNHILHDGWDEHDVRQAIAKSPEYRQKNSMSRKDAEEVVRRAYRSVLHRDPDSGGSRGFVDHVLNDHWTERDVARQLRNSKEYRSKHK